ncbi:hypothetical protein BD413DRAFT_610268 [Trametes elegans]|nr:hypothetical protein BD413DRAFT_610268 [Trametes elegans]
MARRANGTTKAVKPRGGKAAPVSAEPSSPAKPLGQSTRANRKHPSSPVIPDEGLVKCGKGDRPIRRNLGMPNRAEYAAVEGEYLASLGPRKQAKALISHTLFHDIWCTLHRPKNQTIGTPQFRWWVRKMFTLQPRAEIVLPGPMVRESPPEDRSPFVVIHDGKRIAVKERIYDIIAFYHARVDHGGRDKTAQEIRKRYTWVPKELIAGFVKNCPTCIYKRTGKYDEARAANLERGESPLGEDLWTMAQDALEDYDGIARGATEQEATHLVPLSELPPEPGLHHPDYYQRTAHHEVDPLLLPAPSLVPWYLSPIAAAGPSGSGPGTDSRAPAVSHFGNPGPPVRYASWNLTPTDVTYQHSAAPYDEHVRLPSIHTCGRTHHATAEHPKVNLPPLAQLLAAGPMLERRPLDAFSQAGDVHGFMPQLHAHGAPRYYGVPSQQVAAGPYVPQIDPALLQEDGVGMLAMAAEAAQAEARTRAGEFAMQGT